MFQRTFITLLAASLAGCGSTPPAAPTAAAAPELKSSTSAAPQPKPVVPSVSSNATAAKPAAANPAAAPAAALPTVPAGARFTIFCGTYNGADHVKFANDLKALLTKNTKLKDWYLVHQASQSSLYHGYYAEIDPAAAGNDKNLKREAERAKNDLGLVQSIPNPQAIDRKLFGGSMLLTLDAPDPDAPPAWNLTNAPGFWSVQVAAYTGADRKRETVDAVRRAREMNIPAFYYHGPNISSVCVGNWDRGAVKEQNVGVAGKIGNDPNAREDGSFVVDLRGDANDDLKPQLDANGKPVRVLKAKIEVIDPTLLKTLQDYPAQAVDDQEVPLKGTDKNGKPVLRTRPSMIVMIPRGEPTNTANAAQTNEPEPTLINPNARSNDLGSRLRGIGQ